MNQQKPHHDVLIVGAGISGICMAVYLRELCPERSWTIIERRADLGGTWDLFRYPGVRSDSDMHSLGFSFEPWVEDEAIAGGDAILAYLRNVAVERDILPHIRFGTRVIAADFREAEGRWHVTLEDADGRREVTAGFLYLGAGYYDYDSPHDPAFPGQEDFAGTIVHPQFWPTGMDHAGKRVVVIGSGATAVTLVPALARDAEHVTMLQRTPTWMGAMPSRDPLARVLRAILPRRLASRIVRRKSIVMQGLIYRHARRNPGRMGRMLTRAARKALGPRYSERDWLPPYGPWEQRLCLVPDGDLFDAVRQGTADVVTGQIERFDQSGIVLESGEHLDADMIVTATGLRLAIAGNIAVTLDGARVQWRKHYYYRSCMFSNVPNLAVVFGYLNASWTLRAEATARYVCQVLNHMAATGADVVRPWLPDDHGLAEANVYDFSSGYIQRALPLMPKSAKHLPWRLNQDYREDCRDFRRRPVDDGILRFSRIGRPDTTPAVAQADNLS